MLGPNHTTMPPLLAKEMTRTRGVLLKDISKFMGAETNHDCPSKLHRNEEHLKAVQA